MRPDHPLRVIRGLVNSALAVFLGVVGLCVDDPVWDATTFTKNRDRRLQGDVALEFMRALLAKPKVKVLLSSEHFSVDGTLLEAWASTKSLRPKDGQGPPPGTGRNGEQNFHGQKRSNETHASTTDPDARLYRKGRGKEAKLAFMGHALMENRNDLIVGADATPASGRASILAAPAEPKISGDGCAMAKARLKAPQCVKNAMLNDGFSAAY